MENIDLDGRVILKCIFTEWGCWGIDWIDGAQIGTVGGICEYTDEHSRSKKKQEISWPGEKPLASGEDLFSMELVSH